jgi:integrase
MSTLLDVFEDFILSREAALCSPETIDFYQRMLKPFLTMANGGQPSNRLVREFLLTVAQRGVSSATVHAHARAVRAFLRFAYEEGWIEEPVTVRMPRLEQKRMEALSPEDVKRVLDVCGARDRSLVMTLIDSGLRRGEALALDWEDIDIHTGAVHVRRGKGGKARVTYVGAKTRRALVRWGGGQRSSAIFPLTPSGGATLMARLSRKVGILESRRGATGREAGAN